MNEQSVNTGSTFDQSNQAIYGPQTNVAGNMAVGAPPSRIDEPGTNQNLGHAPLQTNGKNSFDLSGQWVRSQLNVAGNYISTMPRWLIVFLALAALLIAIGVTLTYTTTHEGNLDSQTRDNALNQQVHAIAAVVQPTPTPVSMDEGHFNIAVAELQVIDQNGNRVDEPQGRALALNIVNYLATQKDALNAVLGRDVDLWGPNQQIEPVQTGQEAALTAQKNIDVLIYGSLTVEQNGKWRLTPKFYLADQSFGLADELRGEHALGNPIAYRPDAVASTRDVTTALQMRLDALTQLLIGLSYMSAGDMTSYGRAAAQFQRTADTSAWAQAQDGTGQEILYLFLGNAYLAQGMLTDPESPARMALLIQSRDAFATAIGLNPDYPRSYNGLGSAYFQIANTLQQGEDCVWADADHETAMASYVSAEAAYTHALSTAPGLKPPSGQVDLRAYAGLGRVHFWLGHCANLDQDSAQMDVEWEQARQYYNQAWQEYQTITNPIASLTDLAAMIKTDLATMALSEGFDLLGAQEDEIVAQGWQMIEEAIADYAAALTLAHQSGTDDGAMQRHMNIPYYLIALCIDAQGEAAQAAFDAYLASVADADAARTDVLGVIEQSSPGLWSACTAESS